MPMYDFVCKACGHPFEEIADGDACPPCPACGSEDTVRQLCAPSVKRGAAPFKIGPVRPMAPTQGGPCNGGGCGCSC